MKMMMMKMMMKIMRNIKDSKLHHNALIQLKISINEKEQIEIIIKIK